jgi:signal transduction histidine kinase
MRSSVLRNFSNTKGRTADDADSVSQIARAGRHLLGLINEVLDLARVEAGKLDLTLEAVNLRDTLEEALSLVRPLAAERNVQLVETADACDHDGHLESAALDPGPAQPALQRDQI